MDTEVRHRLRYQTVKCRYRKGTIMRFVLGVNTSLTVTKYYWHIHVCRTSNMFRQRIE